MMKNFENADKTVLSEITDRFHMAYMFDKNKEAHGACHQICWMSD